MIPFDVRWISYFNSIERIIKLFPSIIISLTKIREIEETLVTNNLINQLTKFKNIGLLIGYCDILEDVFCLSKCFQKLCIDLEDVKTMFDKTITSLKMLVKQ